jgi:hypothetical protein
MIVVLAALPVGVATVIGNPIAAWPAAQAGDLNGLVWVDALACLFWVVWAEVAWSVLVEALDMARRAPRPSRAWLAAPQLRGGARMVIGAALMLGTSTITAAASSLQPPAPTVATAPVTPTGNAPPGGAELSLTTDQNPRGTGQRQNPPAARAATAGGPGQQTDPGHTPHGHDHTQDSAWTYTIPADGSGPDTYWGIAEQYCGGGPAWRRVWELNQDRTMPDGTVLSNPDFLRPGWPILVPETPAQASSGQTVTVTPGDTLSGIAAEHNEATATVWQANAGRAEPGGEHFSDPNLIKPGWTIRLPSTATPDDPGGPAPPGETTEPGHTVGPDNENTTRPHQQQTQSPRAHDRGEASRESPHRPPSATHPGAGRHPEMGGPTGPRGHGARQPSPDEHRSVQTLPGETTGGGVTRLPMVAFAGGGVLLAGALWAAVTTYRRRAMGRGEPGQVLPPAPAETAATEKALRAAGRWAEPDVTWLNGQLRALALACTRGYGGENPTGSPGGAGPLGLPRLLAARLGAGELELVLGEPHQTPPSPWRASETGTRWVLSRAESVTPDPATVAGTLAPYPTLASVGYTADGTQWLVNLEGLGTLRVSGDPGACAGLGRFVAAELAHNTWSEMLRVTLAGVGSEMAGLNPDRLRQVDELPTALAEFAGERDEAIAHARQLGVADVPTARVADDRAEPWEPRVLLAAPTGPVETTAVSEAAAATPPGAAVGLVWLAANQQAPEPGEAPDTSPGRAWRLDLDGDGTLWMPGLGLSARAHHIPASEAAELSRMLRSAAAISPVPAPVCPGRGGPPESIDVLGNPAGAPTGPGEPSGPELAVVAGPGPTMARDPQRETPEAAEDGADAHAVGEAESPAQQPPTGSEVRRSAAAAAGAAEQRDEPDPGLDVDVAAWEDPGNPHPKVGLLGPVTVTTGGSSPSPATATARHAEVLAYLALHPRGVSTGRFASDLWPSDPEVATGGPGGGTRPKVRQTASAVRSWLGTNPATGAPWMPKSASLGDAPAYRLDDVLVDAELFRRLRARGSAGIAAGRLDEGLADLARALELVRGRPFEGHLPEGYSWLVDNPADHYYTVMIADAAHQAAAHHLTAGDPAAAAAAAQTALAVAAPGDEAYLDLIAAADQAGNHAEADEWARRVTVRHDAECDEDLPPATFRVLTDRRRAQRAG